MASTSVAGGAALHSGRTGDLDGNLSRVTRELARIRFPVEWDHRGARAGSPMALLPALHYALLGFSRHVTGSLSAAGHDLQAKSDGRFVENAWRALREAFGYNPALTPQQFLSPGFAERKLLLLHDAIELCKRRHNDHARAARVAEAAAAGVGNAVPRVAAMRTTSAAGSAGWNHDNRFGERERRGQRRRRRGSQRCGGCGGEQSRRGFICLTGK